MTFRTSRTFDVVFIALLGLGLWQAYDHRVAISDWVFFLSYSPSARVTQLADSAGLNDTGRRLLYRTSPQLASAPKITEVCGPDRLGCLDEHGTAYILADTTKPNQSVVTAVHEMLHLAYRRLPARKIDVLATSLDAGIQANSAQINPELQGESDASDRRDEAHSLLGTEYKNIPPDLEEYYRTYFADRAKMLAASGAETTENE